MTDDGLRGLVRTVTAVRPSRLVPILACALLAASAPAWAQSWWPFGGGSSEEERPPPVPREPVYRDDYPEAPPVPGQQPGTLPSTQPGTGAWGSRANSICFQLEQRLVQETQKSNDPRAGLPAIENELRQVNAAYHQGERELERTGCYDYFLFSKTLRRTRRCVDLAATVDDNRQRATELEAQRQQILGSSGRSYRDDIIRELARNKCGANYEQQARRQESTNPFSSLWQDDESSYGGGGLGTYGNVPYATYRTVCVRLCDGYYFPISFSTLPSHFERDAEACHAKCAAPAELYYYQNPGGAVDQMVAIGTNEQYTALKTAFRYRKEYVNGCSCKTTEYVPPEGAPQQQGAVAPPVATSSTDQSAAAPPTEEEQLPWQPR